MAHNTSLTQDQRRRYEASKARRAANPGSTCPRWEPFQLSDEQRYLAGFGINEPFVHVERCIVDGMPGVLL